jgi:hypothetical protein
MQQLDATIADEINWHLYKRTRVFGTLPFTIIPQIKTPRVWGLTVNHNFQADNF